jgi:uncharacterized protein YukE
MASYESLSRHIGQMKDAWRDEFRRTRAEITKLQAKLDDLRQKLNNADEILASAKASAAANPKTTNGNKYAKMGPVAAVRDFFSEHRFTRHNISNVTRQLQLQGFPSSDNIRDIVSQTMRRLYKIEGFLDSELQDGVRVFWVKDKAQALKKEQAGAG